MSDQPPENLAAAVRDGDRRALARAITVVESTHDDHRRQAEALLDELLPATGKAIRVGISGPPGAGKSTFIEAAGLSLVEGGHKVAVLAVDPSSTRSGGSILGDKTRMTDLARHPDAFIRPSPSGGTLGGLARRTRDALLVCEAAGFDTVLVETVGVGQSEVAVADVVDLFCLLIAPAGGDDLQGIKRGIMELADLVVVTKADGDLAPAAERAAADYRHALGLLRARWDAWTPQVLTCSAIEGGGVPEVLDTVAAFHLAVSASGELTNHRSRQAVAWLWSEVQEVLLDRFRADPAVQARLHDLEGAVGAGRRSVPSAARELLEAFVP